MGFQPFRPDSGYFQGPWANPLEAGYSLNDGDPGRGHGPLLPRPFGFQAWLAQNCRSEPVFLFRRLPYEPARFFLLVVPLLGGPLFQPKSVRIPESLILHRFFEKPWPDFSPMRVFGRRAGFRPTSFGGRKPALPWGQFSRKTRNFHVAGQPGARVSRSDHPLSWIPSAVRQQTLSPNLGPSTVRPPAFSTGVPDKSRLCHGHWISLSMALREFSHPLLWPMPFVS